MSSKRNFLLSSFVIFLLASCSLGVSDGEKKIAERVLKPSESEQSVLSPVEISIDELVGVWKYAEVRTTVNSAGVEPIGEILLGITEEFTLSFATDGIEELKENLAGIPSLFTIEDNKICAADVSAELDFKMNFRTKKVTCYLLNENEMILGKQGADPSMPIIYLYYTRVE